MTIDFALVIIDGIISSFSRVTPAYDFQAQANRMNPTGTEDHDLYHIHIAIDADRDVTYDYTHIWEDS